MGILDRFSKKKKEEEKPIEKPKEVKEIATDLETVCADDKEAFEVLYHTMLLDPRKLRVSMEEAVKRAQNYEKSGDVDEAKRWWETAGKLAIYQGDVAKVKEYFGKCKELVPDRDYLILEIPERAVKKAQEYYQKHLKAEEEK